MKEDKQKDGAMMDLSSVNWVLAKVERDAHNKAIDEVDKMLFDGLPENSPYNFLRRQLHALKKGVSVIPPPLVPHVEEMIERYQESRQAKSP